MMQRGGVCGGCVVRLGVRREVCVAGKALLGGKALTKGVVCSWNGVVFVLLGGAGGCFVELGVWGWVVLG